MTLYAALLRGLPWSCSAHAKDIWTTPEWEKREKLAACAWMTTCTEVNARHLRGLAGADRHVDLIYHGLDTRRFAPSPIAHNTGDGTDPDRPVGILTVGRAVDKKGFDDLLAALARIPPGRHWRLVHIGGGPLLGKLKDTARRLGITERIDWRGPQAQAAVLAATARRTSSRCPAAFPPTVTATGSPTCCSRRKARSSLACRPAFPAYPS